MKRYLPILGLLMLFADPALADTTTLRPVALKAIAIAGDAGAPTFAVQNVGATYELRARDFASGAVRNNLVYQRFDLSVLGDAVIESAALRFNRTAGDGLATGRFALYGLLSASDNLAQNWTAETFSYGAEFDPKMFFDLQASSGLCPVSLAAVADFSEQETVSTNLATLASADFVAFLQARVEAGGHATLLLGMPSQGTADKKITYAFTDPTLGVALELTYSGAVLPAPANLALGEIDYSMTPSLSLAWDPVEGAEGYNVYRRAAGETTATLVGTPIEPSFIDADVELFGTYYYSVDVVTSDEQSAPSPELEVRVIDAALGAPAAPAGLRTTEASPNGIALAWDAVPNALFYQVFRSTESDGAYSLLTTVEAPELSDGGLKAFQSYHYRVRTVSAGGISRHSLTWTVGPRFTEGPRPPRPRDLAAPSRTPYSVDLTWSATVHAQAYYVYRSTRRDGGYTLVGITETNALTDERAVLPQSSYFYVVYAVGPGGLSVGSEVAAVEASIERHRRVERLARAAVAVPTPEGMFVSWRLLGTDRPGIGFSVYRDGLPLEFVPPDGATNLLDPGGTPSSVYEVRTGLGLLGLRGGETATLVDGYLGVPIEPPPAGITPDGQTYTYSANDASAADLDGDGVYELILKWEPTNARDNAEDGFTGNVFIDAYTLSGARLWRIDLGRNIRAGAHYTPFVVYDFDGDGRAETACRTADGTLDGLGAVIGDGQADHRNARGRVLEGPEFLTLFDGVTGAALDSIDYLPQRGNVIDWGDDFGNRSDRFNAGVAYLDGVHPSALFARGYYAGKPGMGPGITVVAALDVSEGQLRSRWVFDTRVAGSANIGQGNHQVTSGDVDGDGRDEVVLGSLVLDDDGSVLYGTGLGHGDAMHLGDLDPTHPGLELFSVKEDATQPYQSAFTDAASGAVLWGVFNGRDTGRGLAADIDPSYAGSEAWGAANASVWSSAGEVIGQRRPSINFAIWWDGDPLRELLDGTSVRKWDWVSQAESVLLDAQGTASNNGSKATPCLQADLLGDWREEVVLRSADSTELRVYTTSIVTEQRIPTLMHDPQYRAAVAQQNSGYNQPPHPSFFIGNNMSAAPVPRVFVDPVPGLIGLREPEDAGSYLTPVLVYLDLNQGGSLVNEYRVDDGGWARYTHPFPVTGQGTHTVAFRTRDATGAWLAETRQTLSIRR